MKEEIKKIAVKSFNDGVDQGVLSLIEIAEKLIKNDEIISFESFVELMKEFNKQGLGKVKIEDFKNE